MPVITSRHDKTILFAAALLLSTVMAAPVSAEDAPTESQVEEEKAPTTMGVKLGTFVLKDYRPIQGQKVRISFTLYAATPIENAKTFEKRLERYQMRVRDQVITAMRLADPLEFEDPQLRLIRRRLDLRLGRALPGLPINEVYFSDFRYLVD